jgi:DNA-binding GntR family transcriptional regulator
LPPWRANVRARALAVPGEGEDTASEVSGTPAGSLTPCRHRLTFSFLPKENTNIVFPQPLRREARRGERLGAASQLLTMLLTPFVFGGLVRIPYPDERSLATRKRSATSTEARSRKSGTSGPLSDLTVERPVAIRKRVYAHLRGRILSGRIPTATRLVEARLAEEIGVSRTPIREALHLLEMEGLLEGHRGGYRVRGIEWCEVEEICEIRTLNESIAARWAIPRLTSEDLGALEENVARCEAEVAAGHTETFPDLDAEFHEILVRASGSRRLEELCQNLRRHMLLYRVESLSLPEVARTAVSGHRRIVEAMRARDVDGVAEAIRAHMEDAKRGIQRHAFRRRRPAAPSGKKSERQRLE